MIPTILDEHLQFDEDTVERIIKFKEEVSRNQINILMAIPRQDTYVFEENNIGNHY